MRVVDFLLAIAYRIPFFPYFSQKYGNNGMSLLIEFFQLLQKTSQYNRNLPDITVSPHPFSVSDLNRTFLLCLDPYAPLYESKGDTIITMAPDLSTALKLKKANSCSKVVVTGPIISKPVIERRKRYEERKKELLDKGGLRITIATGGSLTHGNEIVELVKAYCLAMNSGKNEKVEKISVVVGDSRSIKSGVEEAIQPFKGEIQGKIEIIYDEDPLSLVREADLALGKSDVVHAKTGELVYVVAGGTAFETFYNRPSLAVQEECLREYVEKKTKDEGGNCALMRGLPPMEEVNRVFEQFENGELYTRMELGLRVPAEGAEMVALMASNQIGFCLDGLNQ